LEDLMRDGIVPKHRPAARPKTTTRTGNTPTTVPANARKSDAEKESEALKEATAAASAEPGSTEHASGDTPEAQQHHPTVGDQDPGPEPSLASTGVGEAPGAREAGSS
ncbi:MAG: hypothetical protein OXQ29_17000, partial [Rhodospirillaceae bacterium]|nr:hypothetical protein [Rhodospirillaceae bacterium]